MNKVYFIGGIGASGKSTLAKNLSEILNIPVFNCDEIYWLVKEKLGIKQELLKYAPTTKGWEDPKLFGIENWGIYETPDKLLETCYLEYFNYNLPQSLILESGSIFYNQRELKVLESIFKDYQKRYLATDIKYERWLQNRSERVNLPNETIPEFYDEEIYYKILNDYKKNLMPAGSWTIKDIMNLKCSLTGTENYQSENNNEPKWLIYDFPKEMLGKKFLEIGCNSGYFVKKASEQGAEVGGVDISWQLLDEVLDNTPQATTYLTGIEEFDWNEKFYDYILCSSAFHYFKDRERVIKDISEHTNYFVLETPTLGDNKEDIVYFDFNENKYFCSIPTKKLLLKWLTKYFKSVEELENTKVLDGKPRNVFKCTNL